MVQGSPADDDLQGHGAGQGESSKQLSLSLFSLSPVCCWCGCHLLVTPADHAVSWDSAAVLANGKSSQSGSAGRLHESSGRGGAFLSVHSLTKALRTQGIRIVDFSEFTFNTVPMSIAT